MTKLIIVLLCLLSSVAQAQTSLDLNWGYSIGIAPWNPTYAARPDNTGRALLKYGAYAELMYGHFGLGMTTGMFTDRYQPEWMLPSELDLTPSVIFKYDVYDFRVSYERDMPIDRGGMVQQYLYLVFSRNGQAGIKRF